ncbi:TMEM43 family protein [Lysobacter terrae]
MSAAIAMPRVVIASGLAMLLSLLPAARAAAQGEPEGFPDPGPMLVDPDFKVSTRQFGLDRRVEMYQWRVAEGKFERVWHEALIDSTGLDAAHANPPKLPLDNRRWWAEQPTLDGKPLDPAVLRSLGEWRELRPGFSRLPANLAASFQPEGEGLGSAENPLEPQIGDLRITWRELVLPPLTGKIALRDGVWQLVADPNSDTRPNAQLASTANEPQHAQRVWPFFGAGLLVIAALVVATRRWRRHHPK